MTTCASSWQRLRSRYGNPLRVRRCRAPLRPSSRGGRGLSRWRPVFAGRARGTAGDPGGEATACFCQQAHQCDAEGEQRAHRPRAQVHPRAQPERDHHPARPDHIARHAADPGRGAHRQRRHRGEQPKTPKPAPASAKGCCLRRVGCRFFGHARVALASSKPASPLDVVMSANVAHSFKIDVAVGEGEAAEWANTHALNRSRMRWIKSGRIGRLLDA